MLYPFLIVFGVLVIVGGIQGFVVKGSKASIIAASVLGGLALVAAYLLGRQFTLALILAALAFLGVAGKFFPAFLKSSNKGSALWPAGILGIMGLIGLVLVVLAFLKI